MSTKLTLTVDQEVIESAKQYAKENRRSLSNIVEEYLKSLTEKKSEKRKTRMSKIVKELRGSVKIPNDSRTYKELLQDARIEKHLK